MTKFGSDATNVSPVETASTVKEPIQPDNAGLKAAASIFDTVVSARTAYRKQKGNTAVNDFTTEQMKIVNSIDQGIYNAKTGRQMLRNNFINAMNSNPSFAKELQQAQTFVLGQGGIGSVVTEKSREERGMDDMYDTLLDKGLIDIDASDAEIRATAVEYGASQRALETYQARIRDIDLQLKEGNLTDQQTARLRQQREMVAEEFLSESAPTAYRKFSSDLNKIRNNPNMSASDKTIAVEELWNQMTAEYNTYIQEVDSTRSQAFLKIFEQQKELTLGQINGSIEAGVAEQDNARIRSIITNGWLKNPRAANLIVRYELFKDLPPEANTLFTIESMNELADIMDGNLNTDRVTADPVGNGQVDTFVDTLVNGMNDESPEVQQEVETGVRRLMESISEHEASLARNPKGTVKIAETFASPNFLKLRNQYPDQLADVQDDALEIWNRHFSDEVWDLVRREFKEADVTPYVGNAADDDLSVVGRVQYRAVPSGVEFFATDPTDPSSKDAAFRLNKKLKPIINTSVRAMAHIMGRTDYGTLFTETAEKYLGAPPAGAPGGDTGDELNIEDFVKELAEQAPVLLNVVDVTEGTFGDYNTLLGNINDRQFDGVNVTTKSINWLLEFSAPGGAYADYSRRAVGRVATPMGRYQIVGATLRRVAREMGLSGQEKFTPELQDAMFVYLAQEALKGKTSQSSKRNAMRKVWEGFKYAPNSVLDQAIAEFESNV